MINSYELEIEQLKQIISVTPEDQSAELVVLFRQLDKVESDYRDFLQLLDQDTAQA